MHGTILKGLLKQIEQEAKEKQVDALRFAAFPVASDFCEGEAHGLLRAVEIISKYMEPTGRRCTIAG